MKRIDTYITEKLHINKNVKTYNYFPKDKDELVECIMQKVDKYGLGTKNNPLDLNDIDVSKVTYMGTLFKNAYDAPLSKLTSNGYFDISRWNVSNVVNMLDMFYGSHFDGDISNWDVRNVKVMRWMFAHSNFTGKNGNISKWNLNSNVDMTHMFYNTPLDDNPPQWYKNWLNKQ